MIKAKLSLLAMLVSSLKDNFPFKAMQCGREIYMDWQVLLIYTVSKPKM